MLHCFGLLSAESAGWIPIKQAHSVQVPSYRGMSHEDGNCQSQEMPTQLEQVVGSFLTWFAYEELTMSYDLADLSKYYDAETQSSSLLLLLSST
jgi:hypothetical protein